jgi:uncharacterized protein (DUF2267 family)
MIQDKETDAPIVGGTSRNAIREQDMSFLTKVMSDSGITDPYDARDLTEVVFRIMRDLMTTEAADRVADELKGEAMLQTKDKTLQEEVVDLWKDTNPIVGFLSRMRPPLNGAGLSGIDSDRFLLRAQTESSLPRTVEPEQAVKAVFSATKPELSQERIEEVAGWLPDRVRQLWEAA